MNRNWLYLTLNLMGDSYPEWVNMDQVVRVQPPTPSNPRFTLLMSDHEAFTIEETIKCGEDGTWRVVIGAKPSARQEEIPNHVVVHKHPRGWLVGLVFEDEMAGRATIHALIDLLKVATPPPKKWDGMP